MYIRGTVTEQLGRLNCFVRSVKMLKWIGG